MRDTPAERPVDLEPTAVVRSVSDPATVTVGDLGERATLARLLPLLPLGDETRVGPGDDAAVLASAGPLVVTTDTMIEGPDFRAAWSSWYDRGVKAAATNLADVAAMGARPTGLVVALAVSRQTPVSDLEGFAEGLSDAIAELAPGCGVVGGDLATADRAVIAVTAFGSLDGRSPVLRSGARPGDRVVVAGELGLAGHGLALLFAEAIVNGAEDADAALRLADEHPVAVAAQLRPRPPIQLGVALAAAGATAMLDVSDGLALDAHRIAEASGVRLSLRGSALAAFDAPREHVLHGGEDHALLATLPADSPLPAGVREIGVVETGDGVLLDGEPVEARGWDPYAP